MDVKYSMPEKVDAVKGIVLDKAVGLTDIGQWMESLSSGKLRLSEFQKIYQETMTEGNNENNAYNFNHVTLEAAGNTGHSPCFENRSPQVTSEVTDTPNSPYFGNGSQLTPETAENTTNSPYFGYGSQMTPEAAGNTANSPYFGYESQLTPQTAGNTANSPYFGYESQLTPENAANSPYCGNRSQQMTPEVSESIEKATYIGYGSHQLTLETAKNKRRSPYFEYENHHSEATENTVQSTYFEYANQQMTPEAAENAGQLPLSEYANQATPETVENTRHSPYFGYESHQRTSVVAENPEYSPNIVHLRHNFAVDKREDKFNANTANYQVQSEPIRVRDYTQQFGDEICNFTFKDRYANYANQVNPKVMPDAVGTRTQRYFSNARPNLAFENESRITVNRVNYQVQSTAVGIHGAPQYFENENFQHFKNSSTFEGGNRIISNHANYQVQSKTAGNTQCYGNIRYRSASASGSVNNAAYPVTSEATIGTGIPKYIENGRCNFTSDVGYDCTVTLEDVAKWIHMVKNSKEKLAEFRQFYEEAVAAEMLYDNRWKYEYDEYKHAQFVNCTKKLQTKEARDEKQKKTKRQYTKRKPRQYTEKTKEQNEKEEAKIKRTRTKMKKEEKNKLPDYQYHLNQYLFLNTC